MSEALSPPKKGPNTKIERTNHTPYKLNKVYGSSLHGLDAVIGFGEGNSRYLPYLQTEGLVASISRLDATYDKQPPKPMPHIGQVINADARHCPEIASDTHDAAISSYLLQHLSAEDQVHVMHEMLRVVRPNQGQGDKGGRIMLYPVYRGGNLANMLDSLQADIRATIDYGYHTNNYDDIDDINGPVVSIVKSPHLDIRAYHELFCLLAEKKVFWKRLQRSRRFGADLLALIRGNEIDVVRDYTLAS